MKVVVLGDSFIGLEVFRTAFAAIAQTQDVRFVAMDEGQKLPPTTPSEKGLREYLGSTRQVVSEAKDADVLVVHGAPVSDEVLAAGRSLKVVCCARGGPVNVDIAAATRRGIPIVTAPGKNAVAVSELTIALMIMLSRNVIKAYNHVKTRKIVGQDNFEGAEFQGHELDGKTLGLIGFGRVGSRVARRAIAFGMAVLVYDPFLSSAQIESEGVRAATFDQVLKCDFVSLHARESKENDNLMGAKQFASMKTGSYFINTARPSMVDEAALLEALRSGRLAGAGMDVVRYDPARPVNPLVETENAIVMPHIAGATFETTTKGAFIVATQLERYFRGEKMETVINPETLKGS
jgi:D-3-phosphoglycerate dehydrogenase / 2-oxoglutarate reductase